ncbi:DUF6263 family protein [Mucilaginibacter sp. X5P1]|uniref:DUF6263 family protein n=1 Tax=Mucilaginibacter sp. X5P1 TaxID=2723088 RepID=UPI0016102972|nr:DUF6263 family protein [Mucilaginibacter sp. X5P1]MBB6138280.1 hypothetical protein [Mucilaginibacter sp. X5P1]
MIKSVKNIEEIINNVFDKFPQTDATKKTELKNQFVQYFGGNAFIGNIETQIAIVPRNGVTKSDKWSVYTKLENMGKVNLNTIYHLTGVETNFYKIEGYGTMLTGKRLETQRNKWNASKI